MSRSLVFVLLLSMACSKKESQRLQTFYERTEGRDLSILFGLTLKPRGINEDGTYKVHKIQYNRKEMEPLTIPVFDDKVSKEEWVDSSLFQIKEFAKLRGINKQRAFLKVKAFSDSVISLYNDLGVVSVESYPHLGEFIIFQVNPEEQAIYIRDTSKVFHSYWKQFFQKKELQLENWYYRKKN